ncbi:MAG: DUF4041 domain-containing protein [Planctomycetota bacterium]
MTKELAALLMITLAVLMAAVMTVLHWLARRKTAAAKESLEAKELELKKAEAELRETRNAIDELRLYQKIPDAEAEASRIIRSAREESNQLLRHTQDKTSKALSDAQRRLDSARADSDRIIASARSAASEEARELQRNTQAKASKAISDAEQRLASAIAESDRIIESARSRAEEVAGDALKAKENADHYTRAARAMRNVVEGYGDEYVVPNHSTLDDLAEEFSHKDAGVQLRDARSHSKSLVKNRIAARCDYVEEHRRTTAVRFVLDAFNGKVDSALSRVKHDNFGKLSQEVQDAYDLVNSNGAAFRNARIEPDYLEARLAELKWAVATQELRLQEREEQRRIKEAIREEEKARREYERAQKQAEKEAKMLQKAMIEARKQLEAASAEERAKFEAEVEELQLRVAEAEAKNQRAMSMAQQTKRGHVYVISNIGSFGDDVFKIGLTRRLEPLDRIRELGDASVPFAFDVHAMLYSEDAPALETRLHKLFVDHQINKVNSRKEFFRVSLSAIRSAVETSDDIGEAHWTMVAEAREFRESLALLGAAGEGAIEDRES